MFALLLLVLTLLTYLDIILVAYFAYHGQLSSILFQQRVHASYARLLMLIVLNARRYKYCQINSIEIRKDQFASVQVMQGFSLE